MARGNEFSGPIMFIVFIVLLVLLIVSGLWIFVLGICCLIALVIIGLLLVLFWYAKKRAIYWQSAARASQQGRQRVYRQPGRPRQDGPPIFRTPSGKVPGKEEKPKAETSGPEGRIIDADVDDD